MRTLQRIHQEKGVAISVECPADARFQGERQDLEEMLGNLLDNACKWARHDVALSVEVPPSTGRARSRRLAITVADDGPGLNDEQRARIGKRGLRLDETKPGSGLGLVDRHGACPLLRRHVRTCACTTGWPGGALGPPGGLNC